MRPTRAAEPIESAHIRRFAHDGGQWTVRYLSDRPRMWQSIEEAQAAGYVGSRGPALIFGRVGDELRRLELPADTLTGEGFEAMPDAELGRFLARAPLHA